MFECGSSDNPQNGQKTWNVYLLQFLSTHLNTVFDIFTTIQYIISFLKFRLYIRLRRTILILWLLSLCSRWILSEANNILLSLQFTFKSHFSQPRLVSFFSYFIFLFFSVFFPFQFRHRYSEITRFDTVFKISLFYVL